MSLERLEYPGLGETVYHAKLDAGPAVFVVKKPGFQKKYATFATPYGGANGAFRVAGEGRAVEPPAGVAHFFEHKLFEEPDGNALNKLTDLGTSPNAYTGFNYTVYLFSTVDRFTEAFDILLDYVQHPYFTDENVAKEQGIIGQEIRMYDDMPRWVVYDNFLRAAYHRLPLRDGILGTVESIGRITKELLFDIHRTFYHPGRMTICVVGDLDPEAVVDQVRRDMEPRGYGPPAPAELLWPEEPAPPAQPRIERRMKVGRPHVVLGLKGPPERVAPLGTPEGPAGGDGAADARLRRYLAAELALEAVFGKTTPLYWELYEDGTVTEQFQFEVEWFPRASHALVAGETNRPEKFERRLRAALEDARDRGLDPDTWERVRRQAVGRFYGWLDTPEHLAHGFISLRFLGMEFYRIPEALEAVTREEAEAWLREVVKPAQWVVSAVLPTEGGDAGGR